MRDKKMPSVSERKALESVYDKDGIKLDTYERAAAFATGRAVTTDAQFKSRLKKLRGGRPREDKAAAKAIELRKQGKKYHEIKSQMDKETQEHRSEDAYRKLVSSRKPKARR